MAEAIDGATPPKKKNGKLKWMILLFILLLLGVGGAGAWHFYLAEMWHVFRAGQQSSQPKALSAPKPGEITAATGVVPLPAFTVNLSDPLGRRFIKIYLSVEVKSPTVVTEVQHQEARIRDSIILLLSSKSYADIATIENKMILKNEIAERLNLILGGPKITQVFITDMVIQ